MDQKGVIGGDAFLGSYIMEDGTIPELEPPPEDLFDIKSIIEQDYEKNPLPSDCIIQTFFSMGKPMDVITNLNVFSIDMRSRITHYEDESIKKSMSRWQLVATLLRNEISKISKENSELKEKIEELKEKIEELKEKREPPKKRRK